MHANFASIMAAVGLAQEFRRVAALSTDGIHRDT
jgi:hypothetical protein